jgi:hypothetical protein
MKEQESRRLLSLLTSAAAFLGSLIAISNLMPLLLGLATNGAQPVHILLILGNSAVAGLGIFLLSRQLYTLDKKAGRIRNRIEVFE